MKGAPYKTLAAKKLSKADRENAVLMGLIELYLKMGKPIGSHTMQENGFESLSSATIRNYFSKLENRGYLKQQHISGGRIPTQKAFRLYVDTQGNQTILEPAHEERISKILENPSKEIAITLSRAAEALSDLSQCAVFVSSPRFDQDFLQDIRLIQLDTSRILAVLITDFGLIRTETIHSEQPIDACFLKACEDYLLWRLSKGEKPSFRNDAEAKAAARIYNETMMRHVIGYVNFSNEEILRAGLSKLLSHPEFSETTALAHGLSLLENENDMRTLLRYCCKQSHPMSWIGDELCPYIPPEAECSVIAIPYYINQTIAGAIAILGPMRLPYRNLFGTLQFFSEQLSAALTKSIYKYKITFRQPSSGEKRIEHEDEILKSNRILIENQSEVL